MFKIEKIRIVLQKGKCGYNEIHLEGGIGNTFLKGGTRSFLRKWAKNNNYIIVSEYNINPA